MSNIAINGFGRIGRNAFKIILETPGLNLVAINDLTSISNSAYLLKYDTVYGAYPKSVSFEEGVLKVDRQSYRYLSEKDPAKLPWKDLKVDIVLECTGFFTKRPDLEKHIQAGAKFVLLSAPTSSEEVLTVVHSVNSKGKETPSIISCASCTTNCITPVVEIMGRRIGIQKAIMTTVHAYTSTQFIVDSAGGKDVRRGRAGAINFVPSSTGAATATTRVLPQYKGKFDGVAIRGPVPAGSIADVVFLTNRKTTVDEVNRIFEEEAQSRRYQGILRTTRDPIVSSDIIRDPHASIVDLTLTQIVDGDLVKVMSWYDNEWGYTSQLVREAASLAPASL